MSHVPVGSCLKRSIADCESLKSAHLECHCHMYKLMITEKLISKLKNDTVNNMFRSLFKFIVVKFFTQMSHVPVGSCLKRLTAGRGCLT